jgi:cytochrome c-type biogenesis protein CcmH/NrfF
MSDVAVAVLSYNKQDYTFNASSSRYEAQNGNYIEQNYKVFDTNGNQIGQYYPPLMASSSIGWIIPAILIIGGFIYVFRAEIKKFIK